jgi:hypothetical protein
LRIAWRDAALTVRTGRFGTGCGAGGEVPNRLVGVDVHVESAAALEAKFFFVTPGFYLRSLMIVAPILPPTRR